ncbi:hypothetical protein BJV82DRAFT_632953 [Fennellomyces sp. T-0311]|nr:hypothetical protein BJV82DRAFT_632953 [Fennellomyces sp. T-0311]
MDSQGRSILSSYESTEHALMDSFKAAAVKVTNLYRDSLTQNRRSFGAGYQQAFQDLYGFLSTHSAERGNVPVEDILGFLRQKSAQLAEELGEPVTPAAAPPPPLDGNEMKQQQINESMFPQQIIPPAPNFQIDPNTQFTFTAPCAQVPRYGGLTTWGNDTYHHENHGDSVKRRYGGPEYSFMGRSLSNMNVDEPSHKRGKSKREEV